MNLLLVGFGGGLGAISRYLLTILINRTDETLFPFATFSINVIGCFLIGLAIGNGFDQKDPANYLFIIGFLGSFTTMSAFSSQTMELFSSNQPIMAILYIISTIAVTIIATYIGFNLGK